MKKSIAHAWQESYATEMSNIKNKGRADSGSLTADTRSAIAKKAAEARWDLPEATHAGVMELAGIDISSYVLNDKRRLVSMSGLLGALGMSGGGAGNTGLSNNRLLRFTQGKIISAYISDEAHEMVLSPIKFRGPLGSKGRSMMGYPAELLVELCQAVLSAREDGVLQKQQMHIAKFCEIIVRGLARVGIVALVDEATGYQYERASDNLARILEAYIGKALSAWVKTFPEEYYIQLFRLRGLEYRGTSKRPQIIGADTANIVYERLAPGVLDELRSKNPKRESGKRKNKHHQWLSRGVGHPKLLHHIGSVVALMKISQDMPTFMNHLDHVAPKVGKSGLLPHVSTVPATLRET